MANLVVFNHAWLWQNRELSDVKLILKAVDDDVGGSPPVDKRRRITGGTALLGARPVDSHSSVLGSCSAYFQRRLLTAKEWKQQSEDPTALHPSDAAAEHDQNGSEGSPGSSMQPMASDSPQHAAHQSHEPEQPQQAPASGSAPVKAHPQPGADQPPEEPAPTAASAAVQQARSASQLVLVEHLELHQLAAGHALIKSIYHAALDEELAGDAQQLLEVGCVGSVWGVCGCVDWSCEMTERSSLHA